MKQLILKREDYLNMQNLNYYDESIIAINPIEY